MHQNEQWEGSTELYQSLREMLSDVIARCPESQVDVRGKLVTARTIVRDMENFVRQRVSRDITDLDRFQWNQSLNEIQSGLEELASKVGFGDSLGDTR